MKNIRLAQLLCVVVLGILLVSCNTSRTEEEDSLIQSVEPGFVEFSIVEKESSLIQTRQPDEPSTVDDATDSQSQGQDIQALISTYDEFGYSSSTTLFLTLT